MEYHLLEEKLYHSLGRLWSCHYTPISSFVRLEELKRVGHQEDSAQIQEAAAELSDFAHALWHTSPWSGPGSCCPGDSCRELVEAVTAPFSPVH